MIAKQRFLRVGHSGIVVVAVTFLLANNCLFAAEQGTSESPYLIFPLKHISVEQGRKYLSEVGIGTVSHIPGSSALLVTAQPDELNKLAKAKAILGLVDGPELFVIKSILPISAARNMPSNKQIAARLAPGLTTGISIGSFSKPPDGNTSAKAIIDIHNDVVVAIATVSLLDKIVSAIEQLPNSGKLKAQTEPKAAKPAIPVTRKIPTLSEPNESRYLLAANSKIQIQPNTSATVTEQKTSDQKIPDPSAPNQSYEPAPVINGEEIVNLALADYDQLSIVEFLGLVGPYLQLDFMYDPKLLVGEVTISPNGKFRGPIKIKDLYPLLESVLKFKGFAMTRGKGNLVTIVPEANAFDIDPVLLETEKGKIEHGDGVITRVFELKHIDTANAQNLLTGMRLTTSITPIPETKTLIVTGYTYRMPRIQALLNIIDKPGEPRKFRFRQLQYTMAQTLAPKLQTLAEQLGTISITVAGTSEADPTPVRITKRSNETTAQYQARVRAAEEVARRQRATIRPTTTTQQQESATPTVFLDADERTNRILMIGLNEQLDAVEELVDTLDVAQQDLRTLELYKIEHVDAEEVKKKLAELGIISASQTTAYSSRITGGTTPTTTKPTTTQPPIQNTYETTETPVEEPQVIVVEPTNSLLVNATAEQHIKIARILSYVDSEMLESDIPVQLYPLENQSPSHLAEVLEKLIQETIQDKEGKIEKVISKQDEQIIIVPEPNTFSLIVYASKKNQEWISNIIESLDKRRPQVLIDVTLVQISKTDAFDYDLNILSSFPDLTDTSGLTSAIMGGVEGSNLVANLTNSGRDRFIDFQSQSGNGTGFYGDNHINALLTAMQQKDYGRVLAKPKILVNDNEPGMIKTADTTYVTKQGSTVVEGLQGTVQTSIEFEGYEAGITLEITPHISSGDLLRLDILLTRSDFGTITGVKPPDIQTSDIDTTVTVPDGSTIILGGLLKLNQSKGGTKVPLIGDIPLIGGLFRTASNSDIQRNLYVFVKAEIIRPMESGFAQDDMKRISERNRTAFEEHEAEFQDYHDWPGIKPEPMKPFKVLEAQ